jgi:hypothetical protein
MQKKLLQNQRFALKKEFENQNIEKRNVDINKLLNRVRINKNNEIKKNIYYLGLGIFTSGLLGAFVLIF